MKLADRYDLVAVTLAVIAVVIGGLTTGGWLLSVALGAGIGNVAAYALRRRAGLPDRSPFGRWRAHRASR